MRTNGPLRARSIYYQRARSITGNVPNDERRAIFQQVSHSDVDTGVNVVLINEYPLNDMLYCVPSYEWL